MENITPKDIRERAYQARVSMNKLLKVAQVNNSTFWRWEKDGEGMTTTLHPVTLAKIVDALEGFERERSAA